MTQLFDEGVPGRHFVSKCEVDANVGAAWDDPDNDVKEYVTLLLDEGVPGRHFFHQCRSIMD